MVQLQGHCPACGPERNSEIVGHHHVMNGLGAYWEVDYYILRCLGCDTPYFRKDERYLSSGEEKTRSKYYPATTKRKRPDWVFTLSRADLTLASLADSTYAALDNDLPVLAAIGTRTTFDRASELLGVDPAITFTKKLDVLLHAGRIGSDERMHLDILTDAAGAAAHRGWQPTLAELDTMMAILESFLHGHFVIGDQAKALQKKIPARPRRR
jgi:hypothetical protein